MDQKNKIRKLYGSHRHRPSHRNALRKTSCVSNAAPVEVIDLHDISE